MLKRILSLTIAAAALHGVSAQAQTACEAYTVQTGDSLQSIANRAYSNPSLFRVIYTANRDVIGGDPNQILVGMPLQLPCEDGTVPAASSAAAESSFGTTIDATASDSAAIAPLSEPVAAPAGGMTPFVLPMTFVTGGDYAPFTDPDLPEGGMYTELVRTAVARANPSQDVRIDFVKDWGSHLATLLPNGAYDLGFPWYMPDCTNLGPLNDSDRSRCTDFDHSDPFYEVVVSFFVLADGPYANAQRPEDLFGAKICRPEGYFQFDLAQAGLTTNATMVTPTTPADCIKMVDSGEVDVFTENTLTGIETIESLGLTGKVVQVEALDNILTLHVLTPKTNPMGRSQIATLNAGLRQLVETGEWFTIVSRHLSMQN